MPQAAQACKRHVERRALDLRRASVYKGGMSEVYNGREHEVCGDCGAVVGHGCPTAEHCDCDGSEAQEAQEAEEFDTWCAAHGLDYPPEGDAYEEFLRQRWEESHPSPSYNGPEDDDISF